MIRTTRKTATRRTADALTQVERIREDRKRAEHPRQGDAPKVKPIGPAMARAFDRIDKLFAEKGGQGV